MNPDTSYDPKENDGSASRWERVLDQVDRLRDERKDKEWEEAMKRDEKAKKKIEEP